MGISIPRRYNGLNFSLVPYIMAADMVSRADAGFVNIWGLQDCAETIYEFASEEQKQKYLLSAAYLAKKLNYKLLFHLHRKRFHHVKTVLDTLYH